MEQDQTAVAIPPFLYLADSQNGSSLLFTILALTVLAALGTAVTLLAPGTDQTVLTGADELRARYLALSGLNLWSAGTVGTFALGEDAIILAQSGPDASGAYTITSTGVVHAGTSREARRRVTATRDGGSTITFKNNIDDFNTPVIGKTTNSSQAIVIFSDNPENRPDALSLSTWTSLWSQNVSRYAGGWMRLGGDTSKTVGSVWYGGDSGTCAGGTCNLGSGLRAYFSFVFDGYDDHTQSKQYGDGFTFAVITADNDPQYAVGGPATGVRSELLAYAGPGQTGYGIKPPKIAIEIDTYPNRNDGDPTEPNSRRDASNANHVAIVYWGGADTTYDDNVHGAGTAPQNPLNTSADYCERAKPAGGPNWLEDGEEHALRVELHRSVAGSGATYTVMAWVDPTGAGFDDVTADYTAQSSHIQNSMTLAAAESAKLDAVRFGFTEATGASTSQTVAIHDFSLRFRQ